MHNTHTERSTYIHCKAVERGSLCVCLAQQKTQERININSSHDRGKRSVCVTRSAGRRRKKKKKKEKVNSLHSGQQALFDSRNLFSWLAKLFVDSLKVWSQTFAQLRESRGLNLGKKPPCAAQTRRRRTRPPGPGRKTSAAWTRAPGSWSEGKDEDSGGLFASQHDG